MGHGTLWLALAILAAATVCDLRTRQVPNALPLLLLILAVIATGLGWHAAGWMSLMIGFAGGLLAGLVGFALGMMGGGDVKLLAGLGAVLGMERVLPVLFWVAVVGGLMGVIGRLRKQREIPYVPAIAAGLLLFLVLGGPLDVVRRF
jgi:prepilin peptidase CpaA